MTFILSNIESDIDYPVILTQNTMAKESQSTDTSVIHKKVHRTYANLAP